MPEAHVGEVTLDYDVTGEGEPVLLVAGLGQPAFSWHLGMVGALVDAGFSTITFDNRGMPPSSCPGAPYTIDEMSADTVGLMDHLGLDRASLVGYSLGGWVAETLAANCPERVTDLVLIGSCNRSTAWERATLVLARDLARDEISLPSLFWAVDTMRYLPPSALQDDATVEGWLSILAGEEPWKNPGKLGQLEAAVAWAHDTDRTHRWPEIKARTLVLAFEHDIDSPPARAREAAERIPGARFVELAGAGHLGLITHFAEVASRVVEFLRDRG